MVGRSLAQLFDWLHGFVSRLARIVQKVQTRVFATCWLFAVRQRCRHHAPQTATPLPCNQPTSQPIMKTAPMLACCLCFFVATTDAAPPGLPPSTSTLTSSLPPAPSPFADKVKAALQPMLDEYATLFNMSFSVGVAGPDDPLGFGVAAGLDNPGAPAKTAKNVTTESLFPVGSATKLYTSLAGLQAQEKGLLDLDEPAFKCVVCLGVCTLMLGLLPALPATPR